MTRRFAAMAALAATMTLLAFVLVRPPDAGPPLDEVVREPVVAPVRPAPVAVAPASADEVGAPSSPSTRRSPPGAGGQVGRRRGGTPDQADPLAPPEEPYAATEVAPVDPFEARAEARRARIERLDRSVRAVLENVAPELDPDTITRDCNRGGRRCSFEGPWPGDDFFGRWVRAIGDGTVAREDLQGVTFREFVPVDHPDGTRTFRVVADAPDDP